MERTSSWPQKEANNGAVLGKALLQHTNISGLGRKKHLLHMDLADLCLEDLGIIVFNELNELQLFEEIDFNDTHLCHVRDSSRP